MLQRLSWSWVALVGLASQAFAQPAKVDFARDVQPIFRQNCYGCHGPNQQKNGLRLDRRSSVIKPGVRRVMPGSPENSFLYHRIAGPEFGLQMPPTGPLKPEQIRMIKTWIEQGAPWPDSLANEVELPPLDPKAIAMVDALRAADRKTFDRMVADDPKLLNARGPESSTPFMYAVVYGDAPTIERLLSRGADPNRRNDSGANALMWAALDLEKTKVLLAHKADVNAKSDESRTPLMIAAGHPGGTAVVKLLLEHGANPNPNPNPDSVSSPLIEAAGVGDPESMQALLDHGADYKEVGANVIVAAVGAHCSKCVDMIMSRELSAEQYTAALGGIAADENPQLVRRLIQKGADVNAFDPTGRTPLMYAAISDYLPAEQIKMLLDKGADVNAKSKHSSSADTGLTALDLAMMHGKTPVVDLLLKYGAKPTASAESKESPVRRDNTIEAAVPASLAVLQRADAGFMPKAGCFSCHNQSLTAMAVSSARKHGFRVDEQIAGGQVHANAGALGGVRDILHQGFLIPMVNAGPAILSYVLLGLDAEGYKPDLSTDTVAMYLLAHQMQDGHWAFGPEARPPLCADTFAQTVLSMRALQLYAPNVDRAAYTKSVQLAATWIGEFEPRTNYDLAWRLQGLVWGGKSKEAIQKARRTLLAAQRADGGWGDLASMESGAYTTGLAMIALESSGLPVTDPAYQRGVRYLLNTQLEDGSWHVRSRAAGFQPYFDNGFPHGVDQWISAAGTSLATTALSLANSPNRAVASMTPR